MGFRLSKLYTRTGDAGKTGLADGRRVEKDHPRIEAIGCVDELNSQLGLLLAELEHDGLTELHNTLAPVQHRLFDLGGELAVPGCNIIEASDVVRLEELIDAFNETLEPLTNFILPGGSRAVAMAHQTRSVCRRAERCNITLAAEETINPQSLIYLNRLSDLLFVVARIIGKQKNTPEVLWNPKPKPQ